MRGIVARIKISGLVVVMVLGMCSIAAAQTTVFELDPIKVYGETMPVEGKSTINQKALKAYKVIDIAEILSDELIEASLIRKSAYGNDVGRGAIFTEVFRTHSEGKKRLSLWNG